MINEAWALWVKEMLLKALEDKKNRENIILNIINDIDNEFEELKEFYEEELRQKQQKDKKGVSNA
ncbi:MAG: hypothetical protein QXV73_03990 [Candidatus Micrarchaeia archaeon]